MNLNSVNSNSNSNSNSDNNNNKAQKGWLSRWTRKQWSRHWFVLKNGSLTYYRGPAAELCSFLDGVLDLSLIKHIEVQQQEELAAGSPHQAQHQQQQQHYGQQTQNHYNYYHHHHHHHHHQSPVQLVGVPTLNNQSSTNNAQQFTFSLKMWNGECHLLGAASAAERSLWLEAINACINGEQEDDASTDSASSSDSSPTSNLSTKSTDIGGGSGGSIRTSSLAATMQTGQRHYTTTTNLNQSIKQEDIKKSCKLTQLPTSRNIGNRVQPEVVVVVERQQQQQGNVAAESNMNPILTSTALRYPEKLQQSEAMLGNSSDSSNRHLMANSSSQQNGADFMKALNGSSQADGGESRVDRAKLVASISASQQQVDEDEAGGPEEGVEEEEDDGTDDVGDESEDEDHNVSMDDDDDDDDDNEDDENNQALKRRLISIQAPANQRLPDSMNEPLKLCLTHHQTTSTDLYQKKVQHQAINNNKNSINTTEDHQEDEDDEDEDQEMGSSTSSSSSSSSSSSASNSSDDEDEDGGPVECAPSATSSCRSQAAQSKPTPPESCDEENRKQQQQLSLEPSAEQKQKQKKRVTFDLSLSSMHQLMSSSGSENSCTSGSDSDSSLISSSVSSEDEEDTQQQQQQQLLAKEANEASLESVSPELEQQVPNSEPAASATCRMAEEIDPSTEPTETMINFEAIESRRRVEGLEVRLDEAQNNIGLLERKLSGSYASYNQLEASYKRLQAELAKCDELHKCDLARMQVRVDELTRELSASQLKLVETKDKLLKYEEHLAKQQQQQKHQSGANVNNNNNQNQPPLHNHHNHSHQARSNTQTKALNWLRSNQQVSAGLAQSHQHQPLLLMHHVKHTLAANQQTLGLKLLNHSKQIQKKLNELELKVDQIQSTTTTLTTTTTATSPLVT